MWWQVLWQIVHPTWWQVIWQITVQITVHITVLAKKLKEITKQISISSIKRLLILNLSYQSTCNALCMLSYAHCGDVDNNMVLDKVLCEGDALYQTVIREIKSNGKFIHHLLSLEEIPDDFEVEIGKFTLEKFRIVSGSLIDTQNLGFPTLHEVLQSAFLSVSSGLLTIGAICSAVFKTKG